jgi:hypothetical protein
MVTKETAMLMRVACIALVVSLGLSACTSPSVSRPGETTSTATIPDAGQGNATLPAQAFPVPFTDSPAETSKATDIVQALPGPVSSHSLSGPSLSPTEQMPYRLQPGTPRAIANFIQPDAGCNWMGVGGQAFDIHGQPVTFLVVEVGGTLAGADVFHLELTGNQTKLGPGGYLVTLSNRPIASSGSLWILLYDLAGQPLSNKIYFSTSQECDSNFILINFVEANPNLIPRMYFPIIY